MSQLKLLFAIALLVALTVLTVYVPPNLAAVPPMVIFAAALFVGATFSAVLGIAENLKLGGEIKKLKKEVEKSSEKIKNLQLKIRELEEDNETSPDIDYEPGA